MSKPVDIELLTRHAGENFDAWKKRFRYYMGHEPTLSALLMAPFPQCKTPLCTSQERFRWCMANVGMYKFHEVVVNERRLDNQQPFKLWIFDHDEDAVMFKLRWVNATEDRDYVFNPKDEPAI